MAVLCLQWCEQVEQHAMGAKCLHWCEQVEQQAYEQLERVLWADTAFLASMGVMDYSLLVGVDRNNHTLVIGIIDFIRQVTSHGQLGPLCCMPLLLLEAFIILLILLVSTGPDFKARVT